MSENITNQPADISQLATLLFERDLFRQAALVAVEAEIEASRQEDLSFVGSLLSTAFEARNFDAAENLLALAIFLSEEGDPKEFSATHPDAANTSLSSIITPEITADLANEPSFEGIIFLDRPNAPLHIPELETVSESSDLTDINNPDSVIDSGLEKTRARILAKHPSVKQLFEDDQFWLTHEDHIGSRFTTIENVASLIRLKDDSLEVDEKKAQATINNLRGRLSTHFSVETGTKLSNVEGFDQRTTFLFEEDVIHILDLLAKSDRSKYQISPSDFEGHPLPNKKKQQ